MQEGTLMDFSYTSLNNILILKLIPEDYTVLSFITN